MVRYQKNKEIFIWCCELSEHSGEGKLALSYIRDIKNYLNSKIILKTPELFLNKFNISDLKKKNKNKPKLNRLKYLTPFIGVFFCWVYFFKKKQCCYINYLPLWNSLLFLLLPPKTILGPITGGASYPTKLDFNFIIRNYIFKILYKISLSIIFFRNKKIILSTSLLKKEIPANKLSYCYFNYIFRLLKDFPIKKKDIDILLYNRDHPNKIFQNKNIINFLLKNNINIHVVGAYLSIKKIKNHGYVTNKQVNILLNRSKFTLTSQENFFTLFIIEALSNKVRILTDKNYKQFLNHVNEKVFVNIKSKNVKNIKFKTKTNINNFKIIYNKLKQERIKNNELRNYFIFS